MLRVAVFWCVACCTALATAQDTSGQQEEDTSKITAAIQSYVAAFNARDAAKLANHWSPDGIYTQRDTGEQVAGRSAILQQFQELFRNGESSDLPTLMVTTESIQFISPSVALEQGIATVAHSPDDLEETRYSVVYVKRDGDWLIDRVSEEEIVVPVSNQDKLAPLEFLIGEWVDEADDNRIELNCQWTRNENFISMTFKVISEDEVESSGLQIIGWDPVANEIRSWLFDSDGSFVSGSWTSHDDRWVVQARATLADGSQGSFTGIYRPLEDGTIAWQKVNRVLDGELLPSLDEVVIRRK
jgi:uncharacterized protein (TIGR02246 family)